MTLTDQIKVLFGFTLVNLLIGAQAFTVYMDKYGHCTGGPFDLDGDIYTILHKGGGLQHESLYCDLTFKARVDHGICLTFEQFNIRDCRVTLKIFDRSSASGRSWRSLRCKDDKPTRMCTSKRYVTIALSKERLNRNRNYNFNIEIQEKNKGDNGEVQVGEIGETITGEDVFFASIGIFVAIIVGVIVLIIIIAVVIIYCCCKNKKRRQGSRYHSTSTSPPTHAQPSAPPPPAPTQYFATQNPVPPLYPDLPAEAPPPYSPHAPTYTHPGYGSQSLYTGEPECKQPMV